MGCDANNPCASGCCNKFGFCGLGPDCKRWSPYPQTLECITGHRRLTEPLQIAAVLSAWRTVSLCDRKSYCEPGYGAQWAEVAECPLNVRCSKYGYCGTTKGFCGDTAVKRPSCSSAATVLQQRVIGYYEVWNTRRGCNLVLPEKVASGVYTHINVAFATIDPQTFEIQPSIVVWRTSKTMIRTSSCPSPWAGGRSMTPGAAPRPRFPTLQPRKQTREPSSDL